MKVCHVTSSPRRVTRFGEWQALHSDGRAGVPQTVKLRNCEHNTERVEMVVLDHALPPASLGSTLTQASHNRAFYKIFTCIGILSLFGLNWLGLWAGNTEVKNMNTYARSLDISKRCQDADRNFIGQRDGKIKCNCQDPALPVPRARRNWKLQHQRISKLVNSTKYRRPRVAIFGDSIVERLAGTKLQGTESASSIQKIFEKRMPHSVALGAGGDSSPELLWHLQNGWLVPEFRPEVMVLLIGTNDLGRHGCNKRHTLAGVLNVARWLHLQRPQTPLIVHGILPRFDPKTKKLGKYHRDILWVNQELARLSNSTVLGWSYIDATITFHKNAKLFEDGLHPNEHGYRVWLSKIAARVDTLTSASNKQ